MSGMVRDGKPNVKLFTVEELDKIRAQIEILP
jgi:hypothetical protein